MRSPFVLKVRVAFPQDSSLSTSRTFSHTNVSLIYNTFLCCKLLNIYSSLKNLFSTTKTLSLITLDSRKVQEQDHNGKGWLKDQAQAITMPEAMQTSPPIAGCDLPPPPAAPACSFHQTNCRGEGVNPLCGLTILF